MTARNGCSVTPEPRADYLLALVDDWRHELRELGGRPRWRGRGHSVQRYRARVEPWVERETAIAGAVELAAGLRWQAQRAAAALVPTDTPLEERAVQLRQAGLTFGAVAAALAIPIGTAKTWVRRGRLAGGVP